VFQNSDAQVFAPSVYADVAFGPANLRLSEEEIHTRVADALFAVGLTGYERRPPHHLSGGERKRVAIAGILAMRPEILVAYEPTASLDPATAVEIMDLLDELHEDGTTILLSTHDVELAYRWADEVILLGGGELLHQGTPAAGRSPGTVFLADTDGLTRKRFAGLCAGCPGRRTGAMGTRAKRFCHDAGYLPDYTYGVVDKCLLSAMTVEDTLILTCGGMLDRVELRARLFAEESGVVVPVVRV
jgi:cobalt/nickel transport system ATP-binding protein